MNSAPVPAGLGAEGAVIGRKYKLEGLLGEGGMGSVWRALHLQLDAPVAIKLLRPGVDATELGERLRVEARAVAKLVHPSIVRVFDVGESETGEPFIVMELLNGESLGSLLERGPLPPTRALQLLLPIAEALTLAHARGVVHRDLKPDNIFIAQEGPGLQPKLLDFGIAKVMKTPVPGSASATQGGMLVGSPDYMAPEQVRGYSHIDQRADIWGFCVVLYEAMSGRAPFQGESCQDVLHSVIATEPTPLQLVAPVDAALSALVHAGLAKDRDARPASVLELAQRLAAWLLAQGVQDDAAGASLEAKWLGRPSTGASSEPPLRRKRRWATSALVASAALVGCMAWVTASPSQLAGLFVSELPAATPSVVTATLPATPGQHALDATGSHESMAMEADVVAPTTPPPTRSSPPPRVTSLPQARLAARRPRAELMNPY